MPVWARTQSRCFFPTDSALKGAVSPLRTKGGCGNRDYIQMSKWRLFVAENMIRQGTCLQGKRNHRGGQIRFLLLRPQDHFHRVMLHRAWLRMHETQDLGPIVAGAKGVTVVCVLPLAALWVGAKCTLCSPNPAANKRMQIAQFRVSKAHRFKKGFHRTLH